MTKIYDALRRAEQERTGQPTIEAAASERNMNLPQNHVLRQKLLAVYQGIESSLPEKSSRVIALVAPHPGAGTSTLARELAQLVASELAQRVLLVDAAQNRSGHYEYFGVGMRTGFEDVINGQLQLKEILRPVTNTLSLCCLAADSATAATVAANPAFGELIAQLREQFALILFDAPALGESSDALSIVAESDGVVMVVESEKTRWQAAANAREQIIRQGGSIVGVILNKRQYHIPYAVYKRL